MTDALRSRWVGLAVIVLLAGIFGFLNSGERVAVHLGAFVLYQVPLVVLVFFAFLVGMLTMFLVGLRHDMKVRQALRERRAEPALRRAQAPYAPPVPYVPPDSDRDL